MGQAGQARSRSGSPDRGPGWRERQYAVLAELALLALRQTDLRSVLDAAAHELRRALRCDFAKVLDARMGSAGLLVRAGAGWPEDVVGTREVGEGGSSQGGYTLEARQPVIVDDILEERRFMTAPLLLEHGIRSGISVVIPGEPDPYGVLQADSRIPSWFRRTDIPILQAYARVLGIAIHQHEREQQSADFAAIASHELRTPLTLLIGYSSRLLRRLDEGRVIGADQRDEVELLHDESLRLRRALEMYLALADIELRTTALRAEVVDLVGLAQAACNEIRERFPGADVSVEADDEALPWETDEVAVARILGNLVENGVKYSPQGAAIRLVLSTEAGMAHLSVVDRCGGLSTTDFQRLFGRSFRGQHGRLGRGLGLGLHVSRRLAERVGGSLKAQNAAEGCVFTLRLPPAEDLDDLSGGSPVGNLLRSTVT